MGTWGTGIFSDDTAAEVRDAYRDLLASGKSDAEARAQVLARSLEADSEVRKQIEPTFWLALARTQWEIGRLDEETKAKAIEVIDSGRDIERWQDLGASKADLRKRAKVLGDLRTTLLSAQKPRKVLKPPKKRLSPYQVGDVVRFTLSTEKFVLFRVTSIARDRGREYAITEVLDWVGTSLPSASELAALPCRHWSLAPDYDTEQPLPQAAEVALLVCDVLQLHL